MELQIWYVSYELLIQIYRQIVYVLIFGQVGTITPKWYPLQDNNYRTVEGEVLAYFQLLQVKVCPTFMDVRMDV